MPSYLQADRLLAVTTPLGPDVLLLVGFSGREAISQLFQFHLDLLAENDADVPFDKLLGQPIAVRLALPDGDVRHFHGICSRVGQGPRDETFTSYHMEVVPPLWFLTRIRQSRIFQHITVPDILKKVFTGLDVSYEIQGSFHPRDYCVQYRESDFDFASRLMEEEGVFYFFRHVEDGIKMVVANTPQGHPEIPDPCTLIYEEFRGGTRVEQRIDRWEKVQELRSGKVTLWDHCFELPHKHLESEKIIQDGVATGEVEHKLKIGRNDRLEIYDYPGAYAQRFDGIDRAGGARPTEVDKIFEDNKRTVEIRMQQEALPGLVIRGASNCGHLMTGHKFTLERHFNADGSYLLTGVEHSAKLSGNYRGGDAELLYRNSFECIPMALPFRPVRRTPRPTVQGTQTAVVVGPAGEEIFTDKYSRVKVQFHWDRQGRNDADSSCWVRVGTLWAGKQWGVIHIPRIGQEVIVDFLEGDPDQPIIIGSVYNADMMPPYGLPANKTQSGVKSRSSLGGTPANFNEFRFEDKKGAEQVYLHAEKNQDIEVENDETHWVGHDRTKTIDHDETTHVKHDRTETVDHDEKITIGNNRTELVVKMEKITVGINRTEMVGANEKITIGANRKEKVGINEGIQIGANRTEKVGANEKIKIGANRTEKVGANEKITIGANRTEKVGANEKITIGGGRTESVAKDEKISVGGGRTESVAKDEGVTVSGNRSHTVSKNDSLDVGKVLAIVAGDEISLTTGSASIVMKKNGDITISGKNITITGSGEIVGKATKDMTLKGKKILQN